MPFGLFKRKRSRPPAMPNWPEDKPVPLNHPDLPEAIRRSVLDFMQESGPPHIKSFSKTSGSSSKATLELTVSSFTLHRIETQDGEEWWLFDGDELVETFWLEE